MFKVPSVSDDRIFEINDFKGVDFTTSELDVDSRRSPNAKNIINNNGYNETRPRLNLVNELNGSINGIWNYDTNSGDLFIVHVGTNLYLYESDFSTGTYILSGMTNKRSTGLYFGEYLVIFDGTRTVVFGKFDGINYEAKFLDTCGFIPETSISRDSNGGGVKKDDFNLVSPYAINTFVIEDIEGELDNEGHPTYTTQNTFKLDSTNIVRIVSVELLNANGLFETVNDYTFDLEKGEVYFEPINNVLGRDNVRITYEYMNDPSRINKCSIACLYGFEGNNNRIFATGNLDYINCDYWCEADNPLYWPDTNVARIGVKPIKGYLKLNDGSLAILKEQSDTDNTIFYRTYNMLNNIEVFPLKSGSKNIGCISSYALSNLQNDPLMLSNEGVFAIIGNNGEKFAMQRSFYVNGKLLKEENLNDAIGISVDGKYYLGINNHVYIADSRYLSYPKNARTEQYQYEWYYWDNIPARVFFAWNNNLYIGTEDGKIYNFINGTEEVKSYFETPFLNLGSNQLSKTIKNVLLVLKPKLDTGIELGYILDSGEEEIIKKEYSDISDNFPKVIHEKEKIKKFMFVKFYVKNLENKNMSFERLSLQYRFSGKYKGE